MRICVHSRGAPSAVVLPPLYPLQTLTSSKMDKGGTTIALRIIILTVTEFANDYMILYWARMAWATVEKAT